MEYLKKNLVTENSGILTNTSVCVSPFLKLNKTNSGKNDDKKGSKGSSKSDTATESGKTAVVFSLKNEVGGLVKALKLFQVNVPGFHKWCCVLGAVLDTRAPVHVSMPACS